MKFKNDDLKSNPAAARKKVKDLQARLAASDDHVQHQEGCSEGQLEREEKELERRHVVRHLQREISCLHQTESSLKGQLSSRQSSLSLDPFYNQVDQISEAQIIRDGNPSLNSINDAIDNFVTELLEEAGSLDRPQGTRPPPQELLRFNPSLLVLLQDRTITEEKAGYIVDAALHDFIVTILVDAFFRRPVTHCPNAKNWLPNIDSLYHGLALQGELSILAAGTR
ncbi:hypothetical protein EYR40_004478 [Pleurotus pulmonarius]|nr:hypothetical protein EYR40_004478 [Pleurotus pulmonarius]KAF4607177.1 hypothetical protein EYR38_001237 [Pleurotus pulmonarius]